MNKEEQQQDWYWMGYKDYCRFMPKDMSRMIDDEKQRKLWKSGWEAAEKNFRPPTKADMGHSWD